jgi:hypothetical protein
MVPVGLEWPTLQRAGEEDGGAPGGYQSVDCEGGPLERFDCEDAPVEADNGDFDCGAENEVGEFVCEEDLWRGELVRVLWMQCEGIAMPCRSSSWSPH